MKNGPALAGHGAEAVRDAIARTIVTLPEQLRRSLTRDQGAEMAQHARLKIDAGVQVYFCDLQSPWQRGTNENTNGLVRQYFPKGTDLSMHSAEEIAAVAAALNAGPERRSTGKRPQKRLTSGFHRPTKTALRRPFKSALWSAAWSTSGRPMAIAISPPWLTGSWPGQASRGSTTSACSASCGRTGCYSSGTPAAGPAVSTTARWSSCARTCAGARSL